MGKISWGTLGIGVLIGVIVTFGVSAAVTHYAKPAGDPQPTPSATGA